MSFKLLFSNDSDGKTTIPYQFPAENVICENVLNSTHIVGCLKSSDGKMTSTVQTTTSMDAEQLLLNRVRMVLFIYILPVIILLGIVGNATTFYTIRTSPLKKYSVCIYMVAYCVSNILSLTFNSGVYWIQLMLPQQPFWNTSDTACRLWRFFIHLVSAPDIWFVVAMVIDRFIVVCHPEKQKQMCTKFIAKLVLIIIIVGRVCIMVHALWTYSVTKNNCGIDADDLQSLFWSWTQFVSFNLVPIVVIFVFGNLLCLKLCLKKPQCEKTSMEITNSTTIACCCYFLLKFPVIVMDIIINVRPQSWEENKSIMFRLGSYREIANFMVFVAYSTIFPVLTIFCAEFRRGLIRNFSCCPKKNLHMECTAV